MDLNCMTNEELDELISQIKEVKENRAESRKLTFGIMSGVQCRITSWSVE